MPSSATADRGLTIVRIAVGATFAAHGALKVFSFGHAGVEHMLGGMGVPLPGIAAWGLMAVELVGGALLMVGVGTRVAAALLACDMIGAIVLAKRNAGFFAPQGFELELLLLASCIALMVGGGGALSLGRRARR